MNISVENKGRNGFDVRIGGIDEGQTPTTRLSYYTKVMEVEKEIMERKIQDGEYPYIIAKEMCYSYLYKVRYHIIKD